MIKQVESSEEKDAAYNLICQLHEWLSYPVQTREEYDRRLSLAQEGRYRQYILIMDEKIVGLIGFRVLDDLLRPRRLFIDDLVVDASHRQQGYGRQLLDFAQAFAVKEGCQRLDLEAALKNEVAIKSYERYGMDKVAYLMRKSL